MSVQRAGYSFVLGALGVACSGGAAANPPTESGGSSGSGGAPATGGVPANGGSTPTLMSGGTTGMSGGATGAGGMLTGSGGQSPSSGGQVSGTGGAVGAGGVAGAAGVPATGGATGGNSEVCTRWLGDRANMKEGTWTGSVASCDAGDLPADTRAMVLKLVNLYRSIAGLPPVMDDPAMNAKDQQCALMMRANNMLSHTPPMSWMCWTQAGADAANGSNIGTAPPVASVDGYMLDPGNPTTIGHRRWLLSNSLGPIGIGGTDRTSCLMTLGGTGRAGKAWAAWPSPGQFPVQAMTASRQSTVDVTGWSLQSDSINLGAAQVTVTSDGAPLAVTVTQLGANYGSRYALRFNPQGWTTQAGKRYSVAISGVTPAIAYDIDMVDCK